MPSNKSSQDPKKPKNKIVESFEGLNKNNLVEYAQTNMRDMIAYVMMIVGIILLFFFRIPGGLIVGFVFGIYFANEIVSLVKEFNEFIEDQGIVRSLILGGTLLGCFICAPWIFIGALIAVAVKYLIADRDLT